MKALNTIATIAFAVFMVISLGGCKKSKNSGTAAASGDDSYCEKAEDGVYRDEHGRKCSTTAGKDCSYYRYDEDREIYVDDNNRRVTCDEIEDGYGYSGQGCAIYDVMYPGNHYVAMNIGYNQLICVNTLYLAQAGAWWMDPQYDYYQYYQYEPIYTCDPRYDNCGQDDDDDCRKNLDLRFLLGNSFEIGYETCF